jgi:hypothetical protein
MPHIIQYERRVRSAGYYTIVAKLSDGFTVEYFAAKSQDEILRRWAAIQNTRSVLQRIFAPGWIPPED